MKHFLFISGNWRSISQFPAVECFFLALMGSMVFVLGNENCRVLRWVNTYLCGNVSFASSGEGWRRVQPPFPRRPKLLAHITKWKRCHYKIDVSSRKKTLMLPFVYFLLAIIHNKIKRCAIYTIKIWSFHASCFSFCSSFFISDCSKMLRVWGWAGSF